MTNVNRKKVTQATARAANLHPVEMELKGKLARSLSMIVLENARTLNRKRFRR